MKNELIQSIDLAVKYCSINFRIASLSQQFISNGYKYIFKPNYQIIDVLPTSVFDGIQGINLDLRKKEYIRYDIPIFLQERIPPANRVDIQSILKKYNLKYYDPLKLYLLIKSKYTGDNVVPLQSNNKTRVNYKLKGETNLYQSVKRIIENYALGNEVLVDGFPVNKDAMKNYFLPIYEIMYQKKLVSQRNGVKVRIEKQSYLGRKPIDINEDELLDIYERYIDKTITIQQALELLDISKSTFFRKVNCLKNKKNTNGNKRG